MHCRIGCVMRSYALGVDVRFGLELVVLITHVLLAFNQNAHMQLKRPIGHAASLVAE